MMCLALGLAWFATWEGAGQFGKAASVAGQPVAQGQQSLLVSSIGSASALFSGTGYSYFAAGVAVIGIGSRSLGTSRG